MKVLIADDSPLVRKNLQKLLRSLDTIDETIESENVFSTLEKLDLYRPDVIILDIRMPGGSGFDVLEILGESDAPPLTIVLTNYATDYTKKRCLELGANYFYDKSNEYDKVIHLLTMLGMYYSVKDQTDKNTS